jgi:dihydrofolate reductase
MKVYHIVAASQRGVIGKGNQLPWHFSSDLKRFKEITLGNTIVMGRKTFESIGKPLPGRENFVLSREKKSGEGGVRWFQSFDAARRAVKTEKVFIIGGADLFQQTIDHVDGIYFTSVAGEYEGDTFYPEIPGSFKAVSRERATEEPKLEFIFYDRQEKGDRSPGLIV